MNLTIDLYIPWLTVVDPVNAAGRAFLFKREVWRRVWH